MFIKKDLRKVPQILVDAEEKDETIEDLRLQKRKAEFNGSIKVLCQPESNLHALRRINSLSLYDCDIQDLEGIGELSTLQTLNLGRNPL